MTTAPDTTISSVPAAPVPGEDLDDSSFGRTVVIGAILGIPVTFMVVFAAMLLATNEPGVAPAMLWTALVGGGYFGGFVALNLALAEVERRERLERQRVIAAKAAGPGIPARPAAA